jgi:hypothetical protein
MDPNARAGIRFFDGPERLGNIMRAILLPNRFGLGDYGGQAPVCFLPWPEFWVSQIDC